VYSRDLFWSGLEVGFRGAEIDLGTDLYRGSGGVEIGLEIGFSRDSRGCDIRILYSTQLRIIQLFSSTFD
jgi:hypothetical protein